MDVLKIYYRDEQVLEEEFCKANNCSSCCGTGEDGEPNGYGCDAQEEWEAKNFNNVISEQDDDNYFYSKEEVDKLITTLKAENDRLRCCGNCKFDNRDTRNNGGCFGCIDNKYGVKKYHGWQPRED